MDDLNSFNFTAEQMPIKLARPSWHQGLPRCCVHDIEDGKAQQTPDAHEHVGHVIERWPSSYAAMCVCAFELATSHVEICQKSVSPSSKLHDKKCCSSLGAENLSQ